ncbi:MAG: respiratory chain complex I subunit 1 family protein [Deltaproteobacteria bacterium]
MDIIGQIAAVIMLSPLVSGVITKIKNDLRMRKGQGILQPYYNLAKLMGKDEVVSETASWIFKAAPFVIMASSLAGLFLVPLAVPARDFPGDCLALIFVLGLGRFFMALAALDTASSFGGMGSSREMFISSLAEPAACLAFFTAALPAKTTMIAWMGQGGFHVSALGACCALAMVAIAETSRIPVDNQETHLELTMIHEAMVLEYSGRRLALIEMSSYIRQMVWFSLIAWLVFPAAPAYLFPVKILAIAALVAVLEVSVAKMRLFRAADYFGFAFVLGLISAAAAIFGV